MAAVGRARLAGQDSRSRERDTPARTLGGGVRAPRAQRSRPGPARPDGRTLTLGCAAKKLVKCSPLCIGSVGGAASSPFPPLSAWPLRSCTVRIQRAPILSRRLIGAIKQVAFAAICRRSAVGRPGGRRKRTRNNRPLLELSQHNICAPQTDTRNRARCKQVNGSAAGSAPAARLTTIWPLVCSPGGRPSLVASCWRPRPLHLHRPDEAPEPARCH